MRKARFTDEQMVAILREADREAPAVVAKRHKVSEQTIYNWRKKFGALGTDEVRRLKQLELENGRLIVTDPKGARLDGIRLQGRSRARARLYFSREEKGRLRERRYEFDLVQWIPTSPGRHVVGGVSYTVLTGPKIR